MKKTNIYLTAGLTALLAITSCKKLDITPVFEIAVDQSFQSVKDATAYDNGFYSFFRGRTYGVYNYYSDVQADQLNAGLDFGNNAGAPHRWDDSFSADDQSVGPMWQNYYNAIANLNVAIAGFPNIPATAAADVASINQYTGDAYLARAYYYHKLILRWAKPYEPTTAATDLGVPLVLKYNLTELPSRATVQAVYTQILADITRAESLLANVAGAQGSRYFTIDAARALEARVRLYMKDYAGAYTAATALINSNKYPLITTQSAFTSYWAADGKQESIMQLFINSTTEVPNSSFIFLGVKTATNYDPYFFPSQWVIDSYASTDIRKAAYFSTAYPIVVSGTAYPGVTVVSKFPGNPNFFTTALTNYLQEPKIFRIGEMYCIAAEAAFGAGNEANALTALVALRTARGEAAYTTIPTGATLQQEIRDERTRELAFEGFRLDDLKRWHLGFTRHAPQNVNMLINGPAYYTLSIAADAPKFTWGIPTNDITINKNLVQNPGW